jgi:hypothetical protein
MPPPDPTPRRYYAHTAEDAKGNALPESSGKWQPLSDQLLNVAELAEKFAAPMGAKAATEARLAGLLHRNAACAKRICGGNQLPPQIRIL